MKTHKGYGIYPVFPSGYWQVCVGGTFRTFDTLRGAKEAINQSLKK